MKISWFKNTITKRYMQLNEISKQRPYLPFSSFHTQVFYLPGLLIQKSLISAIKKRYLRAAGMAQGAYAGEGQTELWVQRLGLASVSPAEVWSADELGPIMGKRTLATGGRGTWAASVWNKQMLYLMLTYNIKHFSCKWLTLIFNDLLEVQLPKKKNKNKEHS